MYKNKDKTMMDIDTKAYRKARMRNCCCVSRGCLRCSNMMQITIFSLA